MIIHGDGGHLNEVLSIVRAFSRLGLALWSSRLVQQDWRAAQTSIPIYLCRELNLQWRGRHVLLSVQDFHPFHGEQFLSAGMDNTVKIWSLTGGMEV